MHDDLLDAVDWVLSEMIRTPDKVTIYGGSYGGYAAPVGLTFTHERFAYGVDIVGPSNLNTPLASIPPYWEPFFQDLARRVGDPRTDRERALLKDRSPLWRADQFVSAMQVKNLLVTYVLYPDEGHGFARPQNRTSFFAISEAFLSTCLGGRFEPVGNDFAGSSLQVREGAHHVPGLSDALARMAK